MKFPETRVAVDTETTGLNPYSSKTHIILTQCYSHQGETEVCHLPGPRPPKLTKWLADPSVLTLWWNAGFDIPLLQKEGYKIKGPVIDVSFMARMCCPDEPAFTLKHFSRRFLDDPFLEEVELRKFVRKHKINVREEGFTRIPKHLLVKYGIKDAKNTLELFYYLCPAMDEYGLWPHLAMEMKLLRKVVIPMERKGIRVDKEHAASLALVADKDLKELKSKIVKITRKPAFNPNSHPQVIDAVYSDDHPPTRYSEKTGLPSADEVALLQLNTPLALAIIRYRKIQKASNTYLKNIHKGVDENGIFRVSFNQLGARTGRWSSSGMDVKGQLQNVPRPTSPGVLGKIRNIFVPSEPRNRLIFGDLDQVEMRLMAHALDDKEMIKAIHQGEDLHSLACRRLLHREPDKLYRYVAKTLNYVGTYGASPSKFVEVVLKETDGKIQIDYDLAYEAINNYREMMTPLRTMCDEMIAANGGITTYYGNFIPVSSSKIHAGPNYYIQGTAARYLKLKALEIQKLIEGSNIEMVMQIHDELVFDVPPEEKSYLPKMRRLMEDHDTFKVPITSSWAIGKRWGEKKEIA